jgi:hypothetical protein
MKTMISEIREDTEGIREENKVLRKERGEGGAKEDKKNGRRRRQIG